MQFEQLKTGNTFDFHTTKPKLFNEALGGV